MKRSLYALNSERKVICYPNQRKDMQMHGRVKNYLRCLKSNRQSLSNEIVIEEEKIKVDAKEVNLFSFF